MKITTIMAAFAFVSLLTTSAHADDLITCKFTGPIGEFFDKLEIRVGESGQQGATRLWNGSQEKPSWQAAAIDNWEQVFLVAPVVDSKMSESFEQMHVHLRWEEGGKFAPGETRSGHAVRVLSYVDSEVNPKVPNITIPEVFPMECSW